jgi:SAM-dependent methyltransferase
MYLKRFDTTPFHEGFEQGEPFVLKQDGEIYDEFYVDIYDKLQKTNSRTDYELKYIMNVTQPDEDSTILDIGCGTGHLVNKLQIQGFNVFGIEKAMAMFEQSKKLFPETNIRRGDINDAMLYDRNTFSHILCDNFTIYEFEDKLSLLQNCYYWMKPDSYLMLHLVNRGGFSPIVPMGKPLILDNPQNYSKKRITDTFINFIDFTYKSSYNFDKINENLVIVTETFTDVLSGNVRKNEMTLFMENLEDILQMVQSCGFVLANKISMSGWIGDDQQYLYFFQKKIDMNIL